MLLRLVLLRMSPMIILKMCKNRKTIKWIIAVLTILYVVLGILICYKAVVEEQWRGVVIFAIGLFPQYFIYGLAAWLMMRCIWNSWSERVWNRIYALSVVVVLVGVLAENCWNPKILQVFLNFFK